MELAKDPTRSRPIGQSLRDRYEVLDLVGEGAAARVYRVRDTRSGAIRAAKVLKPEGVAKPEVLRRYEDEYRVLRQLHHPSLPEVYDYGWLGDDGRFIIMEYVDGQPLDAYFRDHPEDLWVLIYELCEVLDFIHDHDLLHQDIKPSNILVRRTSAYGRELPIVTLIDFGLIHRREPGERAEMVGTVAYMAPEVISGMDRLTRAVDYYSLGVSLFELLAGRLPFEGTARDVVAGHLNGEATFEEERMEWAEIYPHVLELLAKDVNARLEGFESLRRTAVGHMTGGIEELEKAYGLSWINSVELISDTNAWRSTVAWVASIAQHARARQEEPATVPPATVTADKGGTSWSELLSPSADQGQAPGTAVADRVEVGKEGQDETRRKRIVVGPVASGKSYFAESVLSEAAILGLNMFRLGEQSDYQRISQDLSSLPIETRRAEAWHHLETLAEEGGCLVHSDHAESLNEEERSFAEYVDTRLSIVSDKNERIAIYSIRQMSASPTRDQRDDTTTTPIEPPSEHSIGRVVGIFSGRVPSTWALAAVQTRVKRASRSPGMLIDALRNDFASGRLRYRGRRWLVDRDLGVREVEPAYRARAEELIKLLPTVEQELFCVLSLHPGFATTNDLAIVTGLSTQAVVSHAKRLQSYGLVHVDRSSGALSAASPIYAGENRLITLQKRRHIHEKWISRILAFRQGDDSERHSQLAFHYQQVGRYRDAMVNYMRAVRLAERVRARDAIHATCERGDRLCVLKRVRMAEPVAGAVRRWFFKRRVAAHWAEHNYPGILSAADEFDSGNDPVPVSAMPMVAYAMIVSRSPTHGRSFIRRCWTKVPRTGPMGVRLEVMMGLAEHNLKRNQRALSCLNRAARSRRELDTEYLARLFIYTALVMDDLGDRKQTKKYLRIGLSKARCYGDADLVGVAQAMQAMELFTDGKLADAKHAIAMGLRSARPKGLLRRLEQLHFLASAVYYELDDYGRALRQLERAIRLSEALAERNRVGMMMIRYGMLHQQMGHLGTASEYLDMALRMSRRIDNPEVALVAQLTRFDVALQLNEEGVSSRIIEFSTGRKIEGDVGRRGWLHALLGEQYRCRGDYTKAVRSYRTARSIYRSAGYNDDAARVMLKEAISQLDLGRYVASERLLESAKAIMARIENPLVRKECRLVDLLLAVARRDRKAAVLRLARMCETDRESLEHADLALRIDAALIRVYARMGNGVAARNAAGRYMRELRKQVANAMEFGVGRRLALRADVASVLQELLVLKRKGLLDGSP